VAGTVLLLHAGIADSRMWRPQVEVLEAAGHRVIATDLRGFGERRLEPAPFSHLREPQRLSTGPWLSWGARSAGGSRSSWLSIGRISCNAWC
jgi:pimeloyl-ACP methyl ester carboxylesterase